MQKKICDVVKKKMENKELIFGVGNANCASLSIYETLGVDFIVIFHTSMDYPKIHNLALGILPIANANDVVLEIGQQSNLATRNVPVLAGCCAGDPFRQMDIFLKNVKQLGFDGVQNYPSAGLVGGNIRENMEISGITYQDEVKMILAANKMGLATCALAFNDKDAQEMARAGAQIIVACSNVIKEDYSDADIEQITEDTLKVVKAVEQISQQTAVLICTCSNVPSLRINQIIIDSNAHGIFDISYMCTHSIALKELRY
jgi:Predicted TIM-barrel enzyme, possibly a dioxygenase